MLIDEESAKFKFCPLQRVALPTGQAGRFVAGINSNRDGGLTTCEGSRCMLWQPQQTVTVPKETDCVHVDGVDPNCERCHGTGKFTEQVQHNIGFCGAGFQGPLASGLVELNKTLAELVALAAEKSK